MIVNYRRWQILSHSQYLQKASEIHTGLDKQVDPVEDIRTADSPKRIYPFQNNRTCAMFRNALALSEVEKQTLRP